MRKLWPAEDDVLTDPTVERLDGFLGLARLARRRPGGRVSHLQARPLNRGSTAPGSRGRPPIRGPRRPARPRRRRLPSGSGPPTSGHVSSTARATPRPARLRASAARQRPAPPRTDSGRQDPWPSPSGRPPRAPSGLIARLGLASRAAARELCAKRRGSIPHRMAAGRRGSHTGSHPVHIRRSCARSFPPSLLPARGP